MTGVADPGSTEDLSVVLTRLMARGYRASEESRRALANDRATRAFLEAGLTLIADELGVGVEPSPTERDDVPRPFFDWLSLNKVVERAREDRPASLAMLRDRWPSRSDFIDDLMAYSLWSFQREQDTVRIREGTASLGSGGDYVEVAHKVLYEILTAMATDRTQRVALLVAAIAGQDEALRSRLAELYKARHDTYQVLINTVGKMRGLKPRPDVDIEEFGYILNALAEGLVLRWIFDPEAVIDHEQGTSLLGRAALLLTAGAADPGDGLTVSDVVRQVTMA